MELNDAVKLRKSTRKFSSKKPNWRDILEAVDFARYAPTAGEIFSMKVMLIDDEKVIHEIAKWSEQDFIAEANYVVVFVSDEGLLTGPFPQGGEVFSHQQAGAAIENFLLALGEFGLSTCWIGHFNEEKVRKALKIPEAYTIEAIFPVGYSDRKSTRLNSSHSGESRMPSSA